MWLHNKTFMEAYGQQLKDINYLIKYLPQNKDNKPDVTDCFQFTNERSIKRDVDVNTKSRS